MRSRFALVVAVLAAAGLLLAAGPVAAQDDLPEVVRDLIEEGDRHRDAGRHEQAIARYREALRLAPAVTEAYVSLGALYVARGELEDALEAFKEGLQAAPDDRNLLFNGAVVAMRLKRFDEALSYVERALGKNRKDAELHALHGALLGRLDRPRDALGALETAARLKPGDPQILFRLGNLHHQLGQREQAIEAYRKAIKKDRSLLRAYYNLGAVLLEMDRYDEALEAYRVALEPLEKAFAAGRTVEVVHARAYQNLGAIYYQKEEWARALDAYGKALRLDPSFTGALYNQGFIYFRLGREDAAEDAYRRALEGDPELPLAYLHLGLIHQRRGELEEAVRWLEQGLPRFAAAEVLAASRALAACQRQLGRPAEAERAYRAVLAAAPDDLPALLELARLLRRSDRGAEARPLVEHARVVDPEHLGAAVELAALARGDGRTAEEKALYEEVLERAGQRPEIWPVRFRLALLLLGEATADAASAAAARRHLEALQASPGSAAGPDPAQRKLIATVYGLLLARDGELQEARQRLDAVLAEDAGFTAAAQVAAVLEALGGDVENAVTALAVAATADPRARANLGQALWLAGRSDEARVHLEAAAAAFPDWLSVGAAVGDVALAQGRYAAATELLGNADELCSGTNGALPRRGTNGALPRRGTNGGLPAGDAQRVFETPVGGLDGGAEKLCRRIGESLATARLGAALEGLEPALRRGNTGAVRALASRALAGALDPRSRAVALFVRGTAQLAQGADSGAQRDLAAAVAGELPTALRAMAHNNLGIARARLGDAEAAREAFTAAGAGSRLAAATLNLGILLDDHTGESQQALARYREYLAQGGSRRRQVESWVERLEKIYP